MPDCSALYFFSSLMYCGSDASTGASMMRNAMRAYDTSVPSRALGTGSLEGHSQKPDCRCMPHQGPQKEQWHKRVPGSSSAFRPIPSAKVDAKACSRGTEGIWWTASRREEGQLPLRCYSVAVKVDPSAARGPCAGGGADRTPGNQKSGGINMGGGAKKKGE